MHGPSSYQLMIEIKDGYQVIIKAPARAALVEKREHNASRGSKWEDLHNWS